MNIRQFGRSGLAAKTGLALIVALAAGPILAGPGEDCPPNPEPGKCYEKVYRPARYEAYVDPQTSPVRPGQAGERVVTRQRKISEASFAWQVVPCQGGPAAGRAPQSRP